MLLVSICALSTHMNCSLTGFYYYLFMYLRISWYFLLSGYLFQDYIFVFLFKITLKQHSFLLTSGLRITVEPWMKTRPLLNVDKMIYSLVVMIIFLNDRACLHSAVPLGHCFPSYHVLLSELHQVRSYNWTQLYRDRKMEVAFWLCRVTWCNC